MQLQQKFTYHPPALKELLIGVHTSGQQKFQLTGLTGSSLGFLVSECFLTTNRQYIVILNDHEEAAYFYDDLVNAGTGIPVLFFPGSLKKKTRSDSIDKSAIILRTEVMNKFQVPDFFSIMVTYPEALAEKVVSKTALEKSTLHLKTGENISIEFMQEVMDDYGFERADFVIRPGQYAMRGSIVDVFSFSNEHPYRIDFFGETIESIRSFSIEDQLSKETATAVTIVPDINNISESQNYVPITDYFPAHSFFWFKNARYCLDRQNELAATVTKENDYSLSFVSGTDFFESLGSFPAAEIGSHNYFGCSEIISFNTTIPPVFGKNFELLCSDLAEKTEQGYSCYIFTENQKQIERLRVIFQDSKKNISFVPVPFTIHEGFIDHDLKYACYTDHQIFDRYHRVKFRGDFTKSETFTLNEIYGLHPGDYIVHIDHGIGIFGGLEKIEINGRMQESIRLVYRDRDVLYVNIHSLHRVAKYKSKDGTPPKIYKLGTETWQKLKQSTKRKVKDIARELIALYAKRKQQPGFSFSPDSYLQTELEASFLYEDTPDQVKATSAVKLDMESETPMDRLICGDVGFGKTEIAIRAAFKAVCDSRQVAILVPTTILALQHYNTFIDRLKNFPCSVDYISRLKSTKKQKETLAAVAEGKTDILIGTHRILGADIKFKNLGLLIIDEEQKFGVAAKEKLRYLKAEVDTLTLTATPIPRTLQFSLMGARDLSIITTPPPNRHPIVTETHTFDEDLIREAIMYEIDRNGQVFFIHNRVQNIGEIALMIEKLCPTVSVAIAHGQLDAGKLEKIMLEFINGDFEVLVATTIIENGLDIPNANTIIINDAQNYGLSDLHQLRGRVGRSNKKAFCYLFAPPLTFVTQEARRRLRAIEEFSDLGSGFNIALQDLDIRGAGNLLGADQSGFIADIGFETYQRILEEAMLELKEEDHQIFEHLPEKKTESAQKYFVNDCHVETDLEILFPDDYIENISERIKLYREIDTLCDEAQMAEFEKNLEDRFGKLPPQSVGLLNVVRLRWVAMGLGIEKIILKNNLLIAGFIPDPKSPFFQTKMFGNVLAFLQSNPSRCRMKESTDKLSLTINKVSSIDEALYVLQTIMAL